jgi:hypothetical protein
MAAAPTVGGGQAITASGDVCRSQQRKVFPPAPPNGLRAFTESPRTDAQSRATSNDRDGVRS